MKKKELEELAAVDIETWGTEARLLAELAATVKTPAAAWLAWQSRRSLPVEAWVKPCRQRRSCPRR